jgi:cytochrome P450
MAHSFSATSLSQLEPVFDTHIKNLLDAIDAKGSDPFDLKALFGFYAYDIIGQLAFNSDFGSQRSQDPKELPPINEHVFLGCMYGMMPSLLPWSMRVANYLPIPWLQNLLKGRKALRDKTSACLTREMSAQKTSDTRSILTRLIQAKDPETGEPLPEVAVASEAFAFLVAGSHTTSGTLTLLFFHLLHEQSVAVTLTKEILAGTSAGNMQVDLVPSYTGLEAQIPFGMACIRENFRVTPVFTMPLPRTVTDPKGAMVCGYHVPAGVSLIFQIYFLLRLANPWQTNVSMSNYVVHVGNP